MLRRSSASSPQHTSAATLRGDSSRQERSPIRADRVAIYIRWSTDDQSQGTTLEVQRERCAQFVYSQGWQVREDLIFVDDGYSGSNLNRPAMTRMRELIRQGEIDCVVVFKIDRLTRNQADAVNLVLHEWDGRCHIRSVTESIDTTNPQGRALFAILAVFAEYEKDVIRDRMFSGRLKRAEDGKSNPTRVPFGYRPVPGKPGTWERDPREASLYEVMVHEVLQGRSCHQIAESLNRAHQRTRSGKPWTLQAVRTILQNPVYTGDLIWGRVTTKIVRDDSAPVRDRRVKRKVRHIPRDQPLVHLKRGEHQLFPALIDRETWERVQTQLALTAQLRKSGGSRSLGSQHLLSGLLACACGGSLIYRSPRAGYGYYVCRGPGGNRQTGRCPHGMRVAAAVAETAVETAFVQSVLACQDPERRVQEAIASARHERLAAERRCAAALARVEEEQARLTRLHDQALEMGISLDRLVGLENRAKERVAQAQAALRECKMALAAIDNEISTLATTFSTMTEIEQWDALSIDRKRQILNMLLDGKITVMQVDGQYQFSFTTTLGEPVETALGEEAQRFPRRSDCI